MIARGINLVLDLIFRAYLVIHRDKFSTPEERQIGAAQWLRDRLRQYPYWRTGHLELARLSLIKEDVATAYASAQAALQLSSSKAQKVQAQELLAASYVKRHVWERALSILEPTAEHLSVFGKETFAAALIGQGDNSRALSMLEKIPKESRSAETHAAIEFLRQKSQNVAP